MCLSTESILVDENSSFPRKESDGQMKFGGDRSIQSSGKIYQEEGSHLQVKPDVSNEPPKAYCSWVTNNGVLPREPMAANITVRLPSLEELDKYAGQQWEVGSYFHIDQEGSRLTESGFQFLLMDTNAQLWYIIMEYISNSEDIVVVSADLIPFLLELSFHVTGELDEIQRITVKDLAARDSLNSSR
ncbi:hypothetical protein L2E82_50537 [Cichorium intybus]|nr:hypothetical protein L2E82_50537 [Cichorium intybus]